MYPIQFSFLFWKLLHWEYFCFVLPGVPAEAGLLSWQGLQRSHAKLLEEKRQAEAELSGHTLTAVREPGVAEEVYRSSVMCGVLFACLV